MDLSQIPLFAMLRGRLGYLAERQKLIAENVANADTPGYQPKDLKPFSFDAKMQAMSASESGSGAASGGLAATQPGHMAMPLNAGSAGRGKFKSAVARDSETRLDGNAVVLEDEMMKMTDARMSYEAAIGFYQKSLGLLQMAMRAPGK